MGFRSSLIVPGVMCALAIATIAAQTPPAQRPPVFTSRVDVVQLDVSVSDKDRQPVRGLAAADFVVKEDGKPVPVVAFQSIDIADPSPPPVPWMRDVTPDVTTNTIADSRLVVIVVDDALIPADQRIVKDAKRIITDVINKLGPADYAAVVFTADSRKAQDFTNDHARLIAALDGFSPGLASWKFGTDTITAVNTDSHYYVGSIRTLSGIAEYFMAVPQRRKALIWVSPGVPVDPTQMGPMIASGVGKGMADHEVMQGLYSDTNELFRRAQQSNVAIYPIDPTGVGGLEEYIARNAGAETASRKAMYTLDFVQAAAASTGGHAIVNATDFGPGIDQIFRENSSYYLLGIQSQNPKQDGSLRRISVDVNRPGVEVRTRSGYYAAKPEDAKRKTSPENLALAKAIGGVLPATDLPLAVTVAPFAVPGARTATVAIALGVRQPLAAGDANAKRTETTELQVSAYTSEGQARGNQRHTAKIVLRPGASGDAEYEVLGRIDLAPGRYRLRLAAHNASAGKTGSVPADVIVPDFANDPFSVSGAIVSVTPAKPSAPRDVLSAVLPLVPTAEREFGVTDAVTAFMRLYQSGRKPATAASVVIRISDGRGGTPINETRAIDIADFATAQPAAQQTAQPASTPPMGRGGMGMPAPPRSDPFVNSALRTADVRYEIPVARLRPGPHLLTFEATAGATTIRRDVRFVVK